MAKVMMTKDESDYTLDVDHATTEDLLKMAGDFQMRVGLVLLQQNVDIEEVKCAMLDLHLGAMEDMEKLYRRDLKVKE